MKEGDGLKAAASGGGVAAVDQPGGAGDVAGGVGGEEGNDFGDLGGPADPPQGKRCALARETRGDVLAAGLDALQQHRGFDVAGTDGIDPDTLGSVIQGHRLGEL